VTRVKKKKKKKGIDFWRPLPGLWCGNKQVMAAGRINKQVMEEDLLATGEPLKSLLVLALPEVPPNVRIPDPIRIYKLVVRV